MSKFFSASLFVALLLLTSSTAIVGSQNFVKAQECRKSYRQDKSRYKNRTAHLALRNNFGKSVRVVLYHPDSQTAQGTWRINPGFHWVNSSGYIIADDWGIQFDGGCIFYVGEVAEY